MNVADKIIVHCAVTPNGKHYTVEDIDQWHGERTPPFMRTMAARLKLNKHLAHIGYHYVIYVDGSIHQGRAEDEPGAHCPGENQRSIGVCMFGTDRFTPAQWDALKALASTKGLPLHGHREFASAIVQGKTCPNFEVAKWMSAGFTPPERAVFS